MPIAYTIHIKQTIVKFCHLWVNRIGANVCRDFRCEHAAVSFCTVDTRKILILEQGVLVNVLLAIWLNFLYTKRPYKIIAYTSIPWPSSLAPLKRHRPEWDLRTGIMLVFLHCWEPTADISMLSIAHKCLMLLLFLLLWHVVAFHYALKPY